MMPLGRLPCKRGIHAAHHRGRVLVVRRQWLALRIEARPAPLTSGPLSSSSSAGPQGGAQTTVTTGPEVEKDGVVAWRGHDVRAMVERRFKVKLALSSAYRLLDELHLSALVPRPRHGDADPAAQAAFRQTSPRG